MINEPDFEGFILNKKDDIEDLLKYEEIFSNKIHLDENDLQECLDIENDAPVSNTLTDGEIMSSVLVAEDDTDSEDDEEMLENKNMSIDNLINVMDVAITGLECRSFISEHELLTMHRFNF